MGKAPRSASAASRAAQLAARFHLLDAYARLARRGEHLFGRLLEGKPAGNGSIPRQIKRSIQPADFSGSKVTGDRMLSAQTTPGLLEQITLVTANADVGAVLESVVSLYGEEIRELLARRDAARWRHAGDKVLEAKSLEALSMQTIDIDAKLSGVMV